MFRNAVIIGIITLCINGAIFAEPIEVLNHSFEFVGGVDQSVKRTGVIPDYWAFDSGGTGVLELQASDGEMCVAVHNVDSVYQLTDHTVASGDEYTLKFDSFFLYADAAAIWNCTFQGQLYYGNGGARTVIDNIERNLSAGMPDWTWHYDYTLTTTIPPGHAAIGNKLGIELATIVTSPTGHTWFGFDNIRLSTARTLPASTFYVDSVTGNDSNTGLSPGQAWQTLVPVNAMTFIGGDQILFKAGTSYTGQLKPAGSGAAGNPIIIDMYGSGAKPRIDGEGLVNPTLYLYNIEYVEVSNLEITNTGVTFAATRRGVYLHLSNFGTAHDVKLKNLYIHDVNGTVIKNDGGGAGIKWHTGGETIQSRYDGLLIENCHLLRCDRDGIKGGGSHWHRDVWFPNLNVVIRNNLLEDIGGDGIVVIQCDGALVEYNTVRDAGQRIPQGDAAAGIWPWSSDNTLMQFNEVSGMRGPWDAQGFDIDWNTEGTIVQYNYSHDNLGGFILICSNGNNVWPVNIGCNNNIVRYNISVNDGFQPTVISPTFHISGSVRNTQIYNNTFYIGTSDVIDIFDYTNWGGPWPEDTFVYNNIFYVAGSASNSSLASAINANYSNNVWYGSISNRPPDAQAILTDPMLVSPASWGDGMDAVDGYKLEGGSPCIATGQTIAGNGGFDYWRNRLDGISLPDRGAHAYTHTYSGDSDFDRDVDVSDLRLFMAYFLGDNSQFDLDGDGNVNIVDFSIVARDWQKSF